MKDDSSHVFSLNATGTVAGTRPKIVIEPTADIHYCKIHFFLLLRSYAGYAVTRLDKARDAARNGGPPSSHCATPKAQTQPLRPNY